ncbi:hypothetical protein B0J13DRAFT_620901 [Dactylonectria estremocensis]|uniref:Uncharacterized protein n=1 Tax=Dactylonectria estremocensis TaxID=1079267 RepID=A0A9P9EZC4_9HYPO|nr:hypothetical protein B0J13DRAFT_620901 [Dactylonectria estremocensis]
MAAVVEERLGTEPPPIIAQEPVYSPTAKRLLTELGIEVVEGYGSLAFAHGDDDAIVLAYAPDIPMKQFVADNARPWVTDEDSPRTHKLVEDYTEYGFLVENERFLDLAIFIRKD